MSRTLFIVYAREDEDALRELQVHLKPIALSENLHVWYDGEILPGQHWDVEIKAHLQNADIILLFISKNFFASQYIQEIEFKNALVRHKEGRSVVIPIIVRPCVWQDAFEVSQFQALPKGAQPIYSWRDIDEALVSVIEGVRKVVQLKRKIIPTEVIEKEEVSQKSKWFVYVTSGILTTIFFMIVVTLNFEQWPLIANNRPSSKLDSLEGNHQVNEMKTKENPVEETELKARIQKNFEKKDSKQNRPSTFVTGGKNGFEMVEVKGGKFQMGSNSRLPEEKPEHTVEVPSFLIGKYEVTQLDWIEIMGGNASTLDCGLCPVTKISWIEVQEFLQKLNEKTGLKYRLPTEAEWEYAARDGKSYGFEFAGSDDIHAVAWHDVNSGGKTHPVGLKNPNALGLYDMSGNVCEWCQDYWHASYEGNVPTDGRAWLKDKTLDARVFRGGCWNRFYLRCDVSARYWDYQHSKFDNLGFRLAHDLNNYQKK